MKQNQVNDSIFPKRANEQLTSQKVPSINESNFLILESPTDLGVARNGGRRGASYAPRAILSQFFKLASHSEKNKIFHIETSTRAEEEANFALTCESESAKILNAIKFYQNTIIHLGGGHDRIYPLLKALDQLGERLVIVNIDPHLDTRTDAELHSGNPFRMFDGIASRSFRLIQLGTESFANPPSNHSALTKGKVEVIYREKILEHQGNLEKFIKSSVNLKSDERLVISLDADCITDLEGVSAPAHRGLTKDLILQILSNLFLLDQKSVFGIYEFNPTFDNLSGSGARYLASLIYECLPN